MTSLSTDPDGSKVKLDFAYDAQGLRIEKVVSTNNGSVYVPESTNIFLYDGWNLVAEVGLGGFAFGGASGGLGLWSSSIAENAFAQTVKINGQASFTEFVGPYLGYDQAEIDAALLQANANASQAAFWSQLQTGALYGLDIYGLPWAEDYTEEQWMALLGLKPPCH